MNGSKTLAAIAMGIVGLCFAGVIGFLTVELSGGGHGWNSALISGLAGLVLLPAFGVAFALRESRAGFVILALVVVGMLATDAAVATTTWQESYYFEKVWQAGSAGIVLWAWLWFGWQVAAGAMLFLTGRRPAGASRI
jgi:hypothetical protein